MVLQVSQCHTLDGTEKLAVFVFNKQKIQTTDCISPNKFCTHNKDLELHPNVSHSRLWEENQLV